MQVEQMKFFCQAGYCSILIVLVLLFTIFTNTTYSQTTFSDEIPITGFDGHFRVMKSVVAADLNGDGIKDIVASSYLDDKIFWLEKLEGHNRFGHIRTITSDLDGAEAVFCSDLDGDGDEDVISASYLDDKISWFENTDGSGNFGPEQVISDDVSGASTIFCIDLDGDEDIDIISGAHTDNEIDWFENTDGFGDFELVQVITTEADGIESVFSIDIDNDGDNDILSASENDDKIAWYENLDGLGTFGLEQLISLTADGAQSVFGADLDGDDDVDVLSASETDGDITWYENIDGLGDFSFQPLINNDADGAQSVFSIDLDGDGDNDVLSASDHINRISWYENTDGLGTFGPSFYISNMQGPNQIFSDDLDNDGDNDVISSIHHTYNWGFGIDSTDHIAFFENKNGLGDFGEPYIVVPETDGPSSVCSADIDGDGDEDIIVASREGDKISWFDNVDGTGSFTVQNIISGLVNSPSWISSSDIDGDGDFDVLSASSNDGKVAWYENVDGAGNFGPQEVITDNMNGANCVYSVDFDNDGDDDVLASSGPMLGDVVWFENLDGQGDFGLSQTISISCANSIYSADLDSDGDYDVLKAESYFDGHFFFSELGWYENLDGLGNFGPISHLTTDIAGYPGSVHSNDLDGDGDNDILVGYMWDGHIGWFENLDGFGDFGEEQFISELNYNSSIITADIDNDDDNDVLVASEGVFWFENTDGLASFGPLQQINAVNTNAFSIYCADLDGNNTLDVLTASDSDVFFASALDDMVLWYRNELDVPPLNLVADPWDDPVMIEPGGGNFRWDVSVENVSNEIIIFDAWTGLILPDGSPYESLAIFNGLTLPPEVEIAASPNQVVPRFAPSGEYTYIARVGDYETGEVYAEDGFLFTKLPLPGASVAQTEMTNSNGWILTDFFVMDETSAEKSSSALPMDFFVVNPYPNPFNPTTTINIGLPETSFLKVNVYNILGQKVAVLANNPLNAGYHSFTLDGSELSSGVYFIHANIHGKMDEMRKVVLMK